MDDSHECPVRGCERRVPSHQLMCRRHWGMVSGTNQWRLYRAWDNGKGAMSPAHREAMTAAIADVEEKLRQDTLF